MHVDATLLEQYLKLSKELAGLAARTDKAAEAARKLGKLASSGRNLVVEGAEELALLKKTLPELKDSNLPQLVAGLNDSLAPLQQAAEADAQREVVRMLDALSQRLSASGLPLEGRYPELTCGVFTLLFENSAKGLQVTLFYGPRIARLEQVAGAEVEKVEKAVLEARKALEEGLLPQETFLPSLLEAWRMVHLRWGRSPEGPVPLLRVLAELCFSVQEEKFLRNPSRTTFRPYGQTSFSYQLSRCEIRSAEGMTMALGIATREDVREGHSLWVPRAARGEGVHYSTLSFRRAE